MTSTAEKIRRKKAKRTVITLAGGMTSTQRPTGRDRRHTNQPKEDERTTAARARCRMLGLEPTRRNLADVLDPSWSEGVGICIKRSARNKAEADRMWWVIEEYRKARRSYRHSIGLSDSPKNAAIAMFPDELVVPADPANDILPPDTRTDEERQRAATRAWMHWQGNIGLVGSVDRVALHWGFDSDASLVDEMGWPTTKGEAFIKAMRSLIALMETQR